MKRWILSREELDTGIRPGLAEKCENGSVIMM